MTRPLVATLAAVLALGMSTMPAQAESVTVSHADLDLSTAAGQKSLERRITAAARQVCGYRQTVTGSRLRSRETQACYDQALQSATRQIATIVGEVRRGG